MRSGGEGERKRMVGFILVLEGPGRRYGGLKLAE